jgi:hypothetical protein
METAVSSQPGQSFVMPLWLRVSIACVAFVDVGLAVWKHHFNFDSVGMLCFGLFWLLFYPVRQRAEPLGEYLKKPRVLVSAVLLFTAMAGFVHNLLVMLAN